MEKVFFENTYGYDNFISEDERLQLYKWALDLKNDMVVATPMNGEKDQCGEELIRQFSKLSELPHIYNFIVDTSNNIQGTSLTHDQICNSLNLDEDDREILRNYNINLAKLWYDNQ